MEVVGPVLGKLTVMEVAEVQKQIMMHIGMTKPDVQSLDFLMDAIPNVHGPDDCTEWKREIMQLGSKDRQKSTREPATLKSQRRDRPTSSKRRTRRRQCQRNPS